MKIFWKVEKIVYDKLSYFLWSLIVMYIVIKGASKPETWLIITLSFIYMPNIAIIIKVKNNPTSFEESSLKGKILKRVSKADIPITIFLFLIYVATCYEIG